MLLYNRESADGHIVSRPASPGSRLACVSSVPSLHSLHASVWLNVCYLRIPGNLEHPRRTTELGETEQGERKKIKITTVKKYIYTNSSDGHISATAEKLIPLHFPFGELSSSSTFARCTAGAHESPVSVSSSAMQTDQRS